MKSLRTEDFLGNAKAGPWRGRARAGEALRLLRGQGSRRHKVELCLLRGLMWLEQEGGDGVRIPARRWLACRAVVGTGL